MRKRIFILYFTFLQIQVLLFSQDKAQYAIDNGEVVFRFDPGCLTSDDVSCQAIHDFDDLQLKDIITSGKWQDWTQNGWILEKLQDGTFQLRKALLDFKGLLSRRDKYLIETAYWKYPYSEGPGKNSDGFVKEKVARIDNRGNATFLLKGFDRAKEVILAGSFNRWDEHAVKMKKTNAGWFIRLELSAGIYEYKFIIDGNWIHDPANKKTVKNQHHTLNSILLVGQKISFQLKGHENATQVYLAGSFNNWNPKATPLKKSRNGWTLEQELPPGKHFYKFVVDGNWILDPGNQLQENDGRGNSNSVVVVRL